MGMYTYQDLRILWYKTNSTEPYGYFQNVSEEAKLILYNSEGYEQIREESIIATNQRFLAVRRIERWWINNNWNPKYKRCRERLDREYQELFPAE